MATSKYSESKTTNIDNNQLEELKISLPKQTWFSQNLLYYNNFWCPDICLAPVIELKTNLDQVLDSDIILTSLPKTGTTWLKSLLFSIVNRQKYSISQHPLHTKNPHQLFIRFENSANSQHFKQLAPSLTPRLFATHIPYATLPDSIRSSSCKIVYVCRNPIDTFISTWHFCIQIKDFIGELSPNIELKEEHVNKFCTGVSPFGPYEEHILGYWNESVKNPNKVLVLEYEGLKKDPKTHLKKLANFLGFPFSKEEEEKNVIEEIIELCSLKSLKEMEVNKNGRIGAMAVNNVLFRKGEVGDWSNDLTPSMAKKLDQMLQGKFMNSGFSFTYYEAQDRSI